MNYPRSMTNAWPGVLLGTMLGAIVLWLPETATAVPIPPNVNISADTATATKSETSIDVNPTDPKNLVVVAHSDDFATLRTFHSTDGGATWTAVSLGTADDGIDSTFRFDPSVSFDDDGNVYVAYGVEHGVVADDPNTPEDETNHGSTTLVVATSTDGGATFGTFVAVATTANPGAGTPGNDKWQLATGPDKLDGNQQNAYVAWTQNTFDGTDSHQPIMIAKSADGGGTFDAPVQVSADDAVGKLFADPAVDKDGNVYVSWHDIISNEVFVTSSQDSGDTWAAGDTLVSAIDPDFTDGGAFNGFKVPVTPQPDRGIHVGPVLDADRSEGPFANRLYEAYVDLEGDYEFGVSEDTDIFVRHSDDGGVTWSDPVRVNDDATENTQFLPWIDVDPIKGFVGVVWYDARNDPFNELVDVFFSFSQDGGLTFMPNIKLSEVMSAVSDFDGNYLEYIGLAGFDHVFSAVWALSIAGSEDLDIITTSFDVVEPTSTVWLVLAMAAAVPVAFRRRAVRA